jgi:curved DNA-binding protein CbpA
MILRFLFLSPSTKHHPDKPGGDVDTFRTLKRAQTVLSNHKLRQQYDILGLDLDDDEVEQNNSGSEDEDNAAQSQTTSQGIVQDIASAALTAVLQVGVRTGT